MTNSSQPQLSKQVWKYHLHPVNDTTSLYMPPDAVFVHAAWQYSQPTLWFEVPQPTPDNVSYIRRVFYIVGTGLSVPMTYKYLSTLTSPRSNLVFHIYEVKP